jgi:hypothetical protein
MNKRDFFKLVGGLFGTALLPVDTPSVISLPPMNRINPEYYTMISVMTDSYREEIDKEIIYRLESISQKTVS